MADRAALAVLSESLLISMCWILARPKRPGQGVQDAFFATVCGQGHTLREDLLDQAHHLHVGDFPFRVHFHPPFPRLILSCLRHRVTRRRSDGSFHVSRVRLGELLGCSSI